MLREMRTQLRLLLGLLALLALVFSPARASAEVSIGPHLGINFDWDEPVIGGEVRADLAQLSPSVQLQIDPTLSLAFPGDGTIFDLSVNLPFQFTINDSVLRPYVAPGLAFLHWSGHRGSDSNLFLNLIGGLLFDLGSVDPFVQLKVMIPHGSLVELLGGVLFRV